MTSVALDEQDMPNENQQAASIALDEQDLSNENPQPAPEEAQEPQLPRLRSRRQLNTSNLTIRCVKCGKFFETPKNSFGNWAQVCSKQCLN